MAHVYTRHCHNSSTLLSKVSDLPKGLTREQQELQSNVNAMAKSVTLLVITFAMKLMQRKRWRTDSSVLIVTGESLCAQQHLETCQAGLLLQMRLGMIELKVFQAQQKSNVIVV